MKQFLLALEKQRFKTQFANDWCEEFCTNLAHSGFQPGSKVQPTWDYELMCLGAALYRINCILEIMKDDCPDRETFKGFAQYLAGRI